MLALSSATGFGMKLSKHILRFISLSAIFLLILGSLFLYFHSIRLSEKLDKERLEKESLLSEKIHLSRSLDELRKEFNSVIGKNRELSRIVESNQQQKSIINKTNQ